MPKIPSFQEEVGVGYTGVGPVTDVNAAGAVGRAISGLANEAQEALNSYRNYKIHKQASDDAIFVKAFRNKALKHAQDVNSKLQNSPELQPDGQNFVQLYDQSFTPLYDEISAVEDGRRRQLAKNIVEEVALQNRKNAYNSEIILGSSYQVRQLGASEKAMSGVIFNDPSLAEQQLAEQVQLIESSPLDRANKDKLIKSAENSVHASAIQHFMSKEDFASAKQYISKVVSGRVEGEELQNLVQEVNSAEEHSYDRNWKREQQEKRRLKEEKEIAMDGIVTTLFDNAVSTDPATRQKTAQQAEYYRKMGMIDDARYTSVMNRINGKTTEGSKDVFFAIKETINQSLTDPSKRKGIEDRIHKAEAEGFLKPEDAASLLNDVRNMKAPKAKGKGGGKAYTRDMKRANDLLKIAFPEHMLEKDFPKKKVRRLEQMHEVNTVRDEFINKGMNPYDATIKALRQVAPTNKVLSNSIITTEASSATEKLQLTEEKKKEILRLKQAAKNGSAEARKKLIEAAKEVKFQKEAAEHAQSIQDTLKRDKKGGK